MSKRALRNWAWTGLDLVGQKFLTVGVAILQARLLSPADFGLIASIGMFSALGSVLIDSGIGQRVVQKPKAERDDFLALFWSSWGVSLIISLGLFFSALPLSRFLSDPRLIPVIRFSALTLLVTQAGRVQMAIIFREQRFKRLGLIGLASNVTGMLVGLTLALLRMGVWALLWQQMARMLVRMALLWISVPWKPELRIRWKYVKDVYSFGLPILAAQVVSSMASRLISVIAMRQNDATAVGMYDRGRFIPQTAEITLMGMFSRVNFPMLARLQKRPRELRVQILSFMEAALWVTAPLMIVLALLASPVTRILLGERWAASAPYLTLSALAFTAAAPYQVSANALRAVGRVTSYFYYHGAHSVFLLIGVAVGARWSIEGMIVGGMIGQFFAYGLMMRGLSRTLEVPVSDQLNCFVRPLGLVAVVAMGLARITDLLRGDWPVLLASSAYLALVGCVLLIVFKWGSPRLAALFLPRILLPESGVAVGLGEE